MKPLHYLLILAFLTSCTAPPEARYTQNSMPESEIAFIKKLTSTDSVYNAQINDITKKEALEKGKIDIAKFILNNRKVTNWVAVVHNIEVKSSPTDYIEVDLFLPVGNWREEKYPHFAFPVFVSLNNIKSGKIKDALKALQKDDEVLISGEVDKNLSGGINIEDFSIELSEVNPFSNLRLDFTLTDIQKSK